MARRTVWAVLLLVTVLATPGLVSAQESVRPQVEAYFQRGANVDASVDVDFSPGAAPAPAATGGGASATDGAGGAGVTVRVDDDDDDDARILDEDDDGHVDDADDDDFFDDDGVTRFSRSGFVSSGFSSRVDLDAEDVLLVLALGGGVRDHDRADVSVTDAARFVRAHPDVLDAGEPVVLHREVEGRLGGALVVEDVRVRAVPVDALPGARDALDAWRAHDASEREVRAALEHAADATRALPRVADDRDTVMLALEGGGTVVTARDLVGVTHDERVVFVERALHPAA